MGSMRPIVDECFYLSLDQVSEKRREIGFQEAKTHLDD